MKQIKIAFIVMICVVVFFTLTACKSRISKVVETELFSDETLFFGALAEAADAYSTTVSFGSYPQSKVTSSATITALNSAAGDRPTIEDSNWAKTLVSEIDDPTVSISDAPNGANKITRAKTVTHAVSRFYDIVYNTDSTWKPFSFASPQKQVTITTDSSTETTTSNSTYGELINGVNYTVTENRTDIYNYSDRNNFKTYAWYADITYSGTKYRGLYFIQYRPYNSIGSFGAENSKQDDNGYSTNSAVWFKYEPMTWFKASTSGGVSTLISTKIIDAQPYQKEWIASVTNSGTELYYHANTTAMPKDDPIISPSSKYASDYSNSSIRSWLNADFYNAAFNSTEKGKIQTTSVDNSAGSTRFEIETTQTNGYSCSNTSDKIYLMSKREYAETFLIKHTPSDKPAYYTVSSDVPVFYATDYAKAMGCGVWSNAGYWWTRSPDYSHTGSALITVGGIDALAVNVNQCDIGVTPVLRANLG